MDEQIRTKIEIIYKDSSGNEHPSYEAAFIAQILLNDGSIFLQSYQLRAIAATIAKHLLPFKLEQDEVYQPTFEEQLAAGQQEMENLHG